MKESHLARPMLQELQELYDISVREHGPRSRSTWIIGEALARERRAAGSPRAGTTQGEGVKARRTEGPH